jgi:hypothetical protein
MRARPSSLPRRNAKLVGFIRSQHILSRKILLVSLVELAVVVMLDGDFGGVKGSESFDNFLDFLLSPRRESVALFLGKHVVG